MSRRPNTADTSLSLRRSGILSGILAGLFWIWGLLGLCVVILALAMTSRLGIIGFGALTYATPIATAWIGGLVFFGLGSLITGQHATTGPVPVFIAKAPAVSRGFDGEYSGYAFRIRDDKAVEAEIQDEIYEFSDWKAFVDYVRS